MTTQTQSTTIRNEIVVDAPLDRAFRVFVEQFDRIKPREHNLLAAPIAETVFEPRAGGHIYDRGEDGSECRWARVLAYEPPDRLVFSWDISPQWRPEADLEKTSEVEVRFVAETPDRIQWEEKRAAWWSSSHLGRTRRPRSRPHAKARGGVPAWWSRD